MNLDSKNFPALFESLTGNRPFPWQEALFKDLISNHPFHEAADIATGLGKTYIIAIWLISLILYPEKIPRRLVYVVNRRTVVDQTTDEITQIRERLKAMPALLKRLQALCAIPTDMPLAISTLRGQYADNREWSLDPARPAVIIGTVDMIGSGLVFNRYTCGFKTRPHHAALLGQDVLLVHDEAHLEPAFQRLLKTIVNEQKRCGDAKPLHVLQLTATRRESGKGFTLTPDDFNHPIVSQRLNAAKHLKFIPVENDKPSTLAEKLVELALNRRDSGRSILIFSRSVEVVQKVVAALETKGLKSVALTGTMRGRERDNLIKQEVFKRFLPSYQSPKNSTGTETCYLVATSAGEVGINISADDLICDLSTYESMAQRLGRVNRFGSLSDSTVEVVHPTSFKNTDSKDPDKIDQLEAAREQTLILLQKLQGNASPAQLSKLDPAERALGFTPLPTILKTTDILFDAWSMTSIREPLPGRPPIAAYLHGEADWQPPETYVAWRSEVEVIVDDLLDIYEPEELLSDFPLKPHELLRSPSSRVREELVKLLKRLGDSSASKIHPWLITAEGKFVTSRSLAYLADKGNEPLLHGATLLLAPSHGGLSNAGLLDGNPASQDNENLDVADTESVQLRIWSNEEDASPSHTHLRLKRSIDTWAQEEDLSAFEEDESDTRRPRYWHWFESKEAAGEDTVRNTTAVYLDAHVADVVGHAASIATKLNLSKSLSRCIILSAKIHDLGKRRQHWQAAIGNKDKSELFAKSGKHPHNKGIKLKPRLGRDPYRHELGSIVDAEIPDGLQQLDEELQNDYKSLTVQEKDIVLHLVAAHHGRARPYFPAKEAFDLGTDNNYADVEKIISEVPLRFARLQRQFGRWGLAYLESLLRAADYAASAEIKPLSADSHV